MDWLFSVKVYNSIVNGYEAIEVLVRIKTGLFSVLIPLALLLLASSVAYAASDDGRKVYNDYCHICHGTGMSDVPQFGDVAHWKSRSEKGMDVLYNAALYGVNAMPPMGLCDECSEQQIMDAVDYMVTSGY